MPYVAKDYGKLIGMNGFSEALLKNHFALYQGYVTNTNKLIDGLAAMAKEGRTAAPEYAELKRRLGWEFNGMRLHELYFENLGGKAALNPGGKLAKAIAEEFRARYGITCEAAQKRDKRLYIDLFNAELKAGRILVPEDSPVIDEYNSLTWADGKQVETPGAPNDCADAVLYAWRKSYYYREQPQLSAPKRGTIAFYEEQERELLAERERSLKNRSRSTWR